MLKTSLYKRFTYPKTKDFWDTIEQIELSYSIDSLDYTVTKRDKIIFQLLYSYGLRPSEALSLSITDFNFDNIENDFGSLGSIFVDCRNIYSVTHQHRLVYPLFPEITEEIKAYLEIHNLFFKNTGNTNIFITTTGNALTLPYINNRLNHYNSKLPFSKKVDSLNTFRQYYIADLLRLEGISQSFINNQIGNNIISNQVYLHLQPNKNRIGVYQ